MSSYNNKILSKIKYSGVGVGVSLGVGAACVIVLGTRTGRLVVISLGLFDILKTGRSEGNVTTL